jgi:hypothetical protein
MHPLLRARGRAYVLDSLVHLAVPVALVPVGVILRRRGHRVSPSLACAFSAVAPVAATVLASVQDVRGGTWGHQSQRLVVSTRDSTALSFRRALIRNLVKVGVPWQLGHVVAISAATGQLDRRHPWAVAATALVYSWAAAEVATTAFGSGHALHDHAAHTTISR